MMAGMTLRCYDMVAHKKKVSESIKAKQETARQLKEDRKMDFVAN
jgi:hypothetical protein